MSTGATYTADWTPRPNGADNNPVDREVSKPAPLAKAAFYGIAGEFVRIVEPHTEADPAALLVQLLTATGVWLGRTGFYLAEADCHYTNLYVAIVGKSAKGRKGTSWGHVRRLLQTVEPTFQPAGGLSTGEGLIHSVRDEKYQEKPIKQRGRIVDYEAERVDPGVPDKRLLVVEPEFSRVLKVAQRDGNTLTAVLRQGWDTGDLRGMTKTSDETATGAHIGIASHITQQELTQTLASVDVANGFANRFLWIYAERSKELPFGGNLKANALDEVKQHLERARSSAQTTQRVQFEDEAAMLWERVYSALSAERLGLSGAILARAEAQVVRLAVLYALLNGATVIRVEHLRAALAVWEYSEASARFIFGDRLGDHTADAIRDFLVTKDKAGATRTEISNLFSRNKPSEELDQIGFGSEYPSY